MGPRQENRRRALRGTSSTHCSPLMSKADAAAILLSLMPAYLLRLWETRFSFERIPGNILRLVCSESFRVVVNCGTCPQDVVGQSVQARYVRQASEGTARSAARAIDFGREWATMPSRSRSSPDSTWKPWCHLNSSAGRRQVQDHG